MPLTPTPLPTALDRLLAAATRISDLVAPAFSGTTTGTSEGHVSGSSSSSSSDERRQKRAVRARYELSNARARLEQLRRVLLLVCSPGDARAFNGVPVIAAERRVLVRVRELVAVLGAGAAVLDGLEKGLWELRVARAMEVGGGGDRDVVCSSRREAEAEVWDLLSGLKDFGMGCWFVLTVLESSSEADAENSRESLRVSAAGIMSKGSELSGEIKALYPEPEPALDASDAQTYTPGSRTQSRIYQAQELEDSDDSDSDTGPPTPSSSEFPFPDTALEGRLATLADVSSLDDVLVPLGDPSTAEVVLTDLLDRVANSRRSEQRISLHDSSPLKVITVGPSGVDISPLPHELTPSAPEAPLSAEAVFKRPEVPEIAVLEFFRRAILVSRFAPHFPDSRPPPDAFFSTRQAAQRARLEEMSPGLFRELCTDVYDELVRRNIEAQQGETAARGRVSAPQVRSVEGRPWLDDLRQLARARLALQRDAEFGSLMAAVLTELERRSHTWPFALSSSDKPQRESRAAQGGTGSASGSSAEPSERWSMEAVREETVWKKSPLRSAYD